MRTGNNEEFLQWIEQIKESDKAVIVEGMKDKKALSSLGARNIFMLNKCPIFQVIEEVADKHRKAIILTDLDSEGKKLYGQLSSGLQMYGVEIDNRFREWLQNNTRISHIEALSRFHRNSIVSTGQSFK